MKTFHHNGVRATGTTNTRWTASFNEETRPAFHLGDHTRNRASGVLYQDGKPEREFDVAIDFSGRFKVAIGTSGHKAIFKVPGRQ